MPRPSAVLAASLGTQAAILNRGNDRRFAAFSEMQGFKRQRLQKMFDSIEKLQDTQQKVAEEKDAKTIGSAMQAFSVTGDPSVFQGLDVKTGKGAQFLTATALRVRASQQRSRQLDISEDQFDLAVRRDKRDARLDTLREKGLNLEITSAEEAQALREEVTRIRKITDGMREEVGLRDLTPRQALNALGGSFDPSALAVLEEEEADRRKAALDLEKTQSAINLNKARTLGTLEPEASASEKRKTFESQAGFTGSILAEQTFNAVVLPVTQAGAVSKVQAAEIRRKAMADLDDEIRIRFKNLTDEQKGILRDKAQADLEARLDEQVVVADPPSVSPGQMTDLVENLTAAFKERASTGSEEQTSTDAGRLTGATSLIPILGPSLALVTGLAPDEASASLSRMVGTAGEPTPQPQTPGQFAAALQDPEFRLTKAPPPEVIEQIAAEILKRRASLLDQSGGAGAPPVQQAPAPQQTQGSGTMGGVKNTVPLFGAAEKKFQGAR